MIQIDIDMPTDCASCWIRQNMGCKIANASGWLNNKRDDDCPLKEQKAVEPKMIMTNAFGYPVYACGKCGLLIAESMNYCYECGKRIEWEGR